VRNAALPADDSAPARRRFRAPARASPIAALCRRVSPRRNPRPAPGPRPAHPRHQRRRRRAHPRTNPQPRQALPGHRQAIRLAKENTATLTWVRGVLHVLRHHSVAGVGFEPT
jgi:hypothetical protein